jgi:hypothetical protein
MPDRPRRILIKGILWELTGILCLTILALLYTDFTLPKAGFIALLYHGIRITMYFAYEELWMQIRWGKIKRKHYGRDSH